MGLGGSVVSMYKQIFLERRGYIETHSVLRMYKPLLVCQNANVDNVGEDVISYFIGKVSFVQAA